METDIGIYTGVAWDKTWAYVVGVAQRNGQELLSRIQLCQAHSPTQVEVHAIVLATQISCSRNWTNV